MTDLDPFSRERTAHEKRHWVRLTRACNNRCRFCLDAHIAGERVRPADAIRAEIEAGAAAGGERLILSGGEPTIHPDYLEMIACGQASGYTWIQTVTNGRMFAYPAFAARAVAAGLREATFSMHGHTARLHDHLVGVPGAFSQALAGMDNLMARGVVVNVDVVLCAPNIRHLPGILRLFVGRGVGEFDLLWMVPFGRAWDNRDELFCDPDDALPMLQEAFRFARQKGIVVWTNRLPPRLLEGNEDLIQDPHKLHDEVRGRRPEFEAWLEGRQPMVCRDPVRCRQCFVRGYCDLLEEVIGFRREGRAPALRMQVQDGRRDRLPEGFGVDRLRLTCDCPQDAAEVVRAMTPPPAALILELERDTGVDPWGLDYGGGTRLERVASAVPGVLDRLLGGPGDCEVILDQRTAQWVRRRQEAVRAAAAGTLLSLAPVLTLAEMDTRGVQPVEALRPLEGAPVRLVNLPGCLLPGSRVVTEPEGIPARCLKSDGTVDLPVLTDSYIRHRYRVFSTRCTGCALRAECPGLPINVVRRHGLRLLCPFGA